MASFIFKGECGTTGCLAGTIVMLSDLPLVETDVWGITHMPDISKLPIEEQHEIESWQEFEENEKETCESVSLLPACARYLWAKEYGKEAAENLPFYDDDWEDIVGFNKKQLDNSENSKTEAFNNLKAQDLILFLKSMG